MKKYVNAKEVLPEHLIREIQKYVRGRHVYIPQTERREWGEATGIRDELARRNAEIGRLYRGGISITDLARTFSLSEERIRSLVYEQL